MAEEHTPFKQKYGFRTMEVGEVVLIPAETKRQEKNGRKAVYNVNATTDKQLSSRLKNGILYVTRIR